MMLKTLFAKIFLGFWLTSIAVAVAMQASTVSILNFGLAGERRDLELAWRRNFATAAQAILQTRGEARLREWLQPFAHGSAVNGGARLIDPSGDERHGVRPPRAVARLLASAAPDQNEIHRAGTSFFRLSDQVGEDRWLAWSPPRRPGFGPPYPALPPPPGSLPQAGFARRWRHAPVLALIPLGVAVLVSGIVCYGLARHFSRPVRALRAANAALARGELQTRVPQELTGRNDELGLLAVDFNRMADAIARMMEAQAQLLRDVSHELRSPLARLQVALELARKHSGGSSEVEHDRIEQEAEQLHALIAQVLVLARLDTAEVVVEHCAFDLAALVDGVVRDALFEAQTRACVLEWQMPSPIRVRGEPALLRSAFENVIRNALRHTPVDGRIVISLAEARPGTCVTLIEDNGPGVPASLLGDIFRPFLRVDTGRSRVDGGAGLGLAIAARAITAHQGSIVARNRPEGGLQIAITLPVDKEDDASPAPA